MLYGYMPIFRADDGYERAVFSHRFKLAERICKKCDGKMRFIQAIDKSICYCPKCDV